MWPSMCSVHVCNTLCIYAALTHPHFLFPLQATFQTTFTPVISVVIIASVLFFAQRGICCLAPSRWPFNIDAYKNKEVWSPFVGLSTKACGRAWSSQCCAAKYRLIQEGTWSSLTSVVLTELCILVHEKLTIWETRMLHNFYVFVTLLLPHFHV